jgi:NTE family protein
MGGGVRGIGYAGAVKAFHSAGYTFKRVAGSSAGAIIAALIAAGYSGKELEEEMMGLNYNKFKGKNILDMFGPLGTALSFSKDYGLHDSDYLEKWMMELLERKNIVKFKDLEYEEDGKIIQPLTITATDVYREKPLQLPRDLVDYGLDPREFEIAKAVRMSMSIPIFYNPYKLFDSKGNEHWIVDGGVLNNYPMWIFDDGKSKPIRPIIGFKFIGGNVKESKKIVQRANFFGKRKELKEYIVKVVDMALGSQNLQYSEIASGDSQRTVNISITVDGRDISPIDFGLTDEDASKLFRNGHLAAAKFLKGWEFHGWLARYRKQHYH